MKASKLNVRKTYLTMKGAFDEIENILKERGGEDQETINENGIPLLVESLYDQLDELKADRAALSHKPEEPLREAIEDVLAERDRQDVKWGEQNHDPFTYLAVLIEEVGEFAQASLHLRFGGKAQDRFRDEAIHMAAVALAIVECIYREKWQWPASVPLRPGVALSRESTPAKALPETAKERVIRVINQSEEEWFAGEPSGGGSNLPADVAELLARCERPDV